MHNYYYEKQSLTGSLIEMQSLALYVYNEK